MNKSTKGDTLSAAQLRFSIVWKSGHRNMLRAKDRSARHAMMATCEKTERLSARRIHAHADALIFQVPHLLLLQRSNSIAESKKEICCSRGSILFSYSLSDRSRLLDHCLLHAELDALNQILAIDVFQVKGVWRSCSDLGNLFGPERLIHQHMVNDGWYSGPQTRCHRSCSSVMDRHLALWKKPLVRCSFDDLDEGRHLEIRELVPSRAEDSPLFGDIKSLNKGHQDLSSISDGHASESHVDGRISGFEKVGEVLRRLKLFGCVEDPTASDLDLLGPI